jgi:hypothetical protein
MGNEADQPIHPMRPVDYVEGPQSTAGRSFVIGAGLLGCVVSAMAIAAWHHDLGRQVPCSAPDQSLFDIPTVGVAIAVILLLGGMAVVVVSQWRKPHRIAAVIGVGILVTAFLWIIAAIAFHNADVPICLWAAPRAPHLALFVASVH